MVSEHTGQKNKSHAHEKNFDEPHQVVTKEIGSTAKNELMRGHFRFMKEK